MSIVGRCADRPEDRAEAKAAKLRAALKDLSRAYVNLLASSRERIVSLGGQCDPVDMMERGDPYLRQAREAIDQS